MRQLLASLLSLLILTAMAKADPETQPFKISQSENSTGSNSWLEGREVDEQACIQAVTRATGNADVVVQKWESADGKTALLLGVDEEREPWRCIVHMGLVEQVRRSQ